MGLNKNFPELKSIDADFCSIRFIFKQNFENLNKLRYLDLDGNKIERINDDTFEDLLSLKVLMLSKYKNISFFLKKLLRSFRLQSNYQHEWAGFPQSQEFNVSWLV